MHQSLQDLTLAEYHNRPDDQAAATRYGEHPRAEILAADADGALRGTWFLGNAPCHGILFDDAGMAQGEAGASIRDVLSRFWNSGKPERVTWTPGTAGF